jgi:hypothetical protein
VTSLHAEPTDGEDGARLVHAWNAARDAEYRELIGVCGKFLAEIEHEFAIGKFTHAELDEEEAELDKLKRWHERIGTRDIHSADGAPAAIDALRAAEQALERYSAAVFERTDPS